MRTISARRRCRSGVALSLVVAAGYAAGLAFSPGAATPSVAEEAHLLGRRAALTASATALGWSLASQKALAIAQSKDGRAEVELAAAALHQLQQDWPKLEKQGEPACGEAVANVLGSTVETSVEISVPAGASPGVDIEGLSVTGVNSKDMGWQKGDFIDKIAGTKPEDQDDAARLVKLARESNQPYKIMATRRFTSPFVGLQKPLQLVYQDSNNPVKEVEEVMNMYGRLRNKAGFVVDGISPASELKTLLDSFTGELDAYLKTGAAAAPKAKSSAPSNDLDGLFG